MNSSVSCKSCVLRGDLCELSLLEPMDYRCYACIRAGADCGIPTADGQLLQSGISTASPTTHPGQRKCLNCAMSNATCTFSLGSGPYPCFSCVRDGVATRMIPPAPYDYTSAQTSPVTMHSSYTNMENSDLQYEISGSQVDPYPQYQDTGDQTSWGDSSAQNQPVETRNSEELPLEAATPRDWNNAETHETWTYPDSQGYSAEAIDADQGPTPGSMADLDSSVVDTLMQDGNHSTFGYRSVEADSSPMIVVETSSNPEPESTDGFEEAYSQFVDLNAF
ncbi:hypothetical protein GGR52DRAFT_525587 [Hypoxylon sp. FL1284]|nr:hypothetical protein GGR52DRAFT_525587 [Hypoxylon sp. FL1284]